ncbi:MAG: TIGR03084 family metal-binding protein [Pseudomonadota bacterium]
MQELCDDFAAECEDLDALLSSLTPEQWRTVTQFEGWTVFDIVAHLHFWNRAALLAVDDATTLATLMDAVRSGLADGKTLRAMEAEYGDPEEAQLHSAWRAQCHRVVECYRGLHASHRVQWAGTSMSVRSALSARLMETWAHAQAIFDVFGRERRHADRVQHVVVLGVNTYAWSFKVRGLEPPGPMPRLALRAPSGASWGYGDAASPDSIRGDAVDFAMVVAQTRNLLDTGLQCEGEAAKAWMACAQCFAGPPADPPPPGARRRVS